MFYLYWKSITDVAPIAAVALSSFGFENPVLNLLMTQKYKYIIYFNNYFLFKIICYVHVR